MWVIADIILAISSFFENRRRSQHRARAIAESYYIVTLPHRDRLHAYMGATEDWQVPRELADLATEARKDALAAYSRVTADAWRFCAAGKLSAQDYRGACTLAEQAYRQRGREIEMQMMTSWTTPDTARFVRAHFYDHRFPRIEVPTALPQCRSPSGNREQQSPESSREARRDATPRSARLPDHRIH